MGKMSLVFYAELGFSKSDIAIYSKGVGWITTVAFTFFGSLIAITSGHRPRVVRSRARDGIY